MPAAVLSTQLYFKLRGVDPKIRFSRKSHMVIRGVHMHHSALGLGISMLGLFVGFWLSFIGLGIFLQHLIFEDLPNRSLVLLERRGKGTSISI